MKLSFRRNLVYLAYVRSRSSNVFVYSTFARTYVSHLLVRPLLSSTFHEMDDAPNIYVQEKGNSSPNFITVSRKGVQKESILYPAIYELSLTMSAMSWFLLKLINLIWKSENEWWRKKTQFKLTLILQSNLKQCDLN